ncbi:hypothetical protein ACLKMH_10210 [Psychromonas sp. KJ10-10]|uniref:AraC family transcriptional regulator n=1 Tax=Psychromonas sp. KJ10-10 TaxID=3391823 RepID=UPI0039B3FD2F
MKVNNTLSATSSKGTFTRYLEDDKKQYIISDRESHSSTIVSGKFLSYQVPNAYTLQGGTTEELVNFQVVSTAQKSMSITILLEGMLDFGYDDQMFHLDANSENSAIVVNLSRPVTFYRIIHENNHVVKLNVSIPLNWIENRENVHDVASSFVKHHLDYFHIKLTDMIVTLSYEIIRLGTPSSLMDKLQMEVLSKSLIFEIFKQLNAQDTLESNKPLIKPQQQKLHNDPFEETLDTLLKYIEENLETPLSVQQLAQYVAMSVSSLQRKFKQEIGYSVQVYIRRRRLETCQTSLRKGLSEHY